MSSITPTRIRRQLEEAEGYLMLEMPANALGILESRAEWPSMPFEASFLKGEALRCLDRYREALVSLEVAAALRPEDVAVALAQFLNSDESPWNLMMATAILYALPPMMLYYMFRRNMTAGLTMGGVKG